LTRRSMPTCGNKTKRRRPMDCRVKPGNDDMEKRSRDASAPESCRHGRKRKRRSRSGAGLLQSTSPVEATKDHPAGSLCLLRPPSLSSPACGGGRWGHTDNEESPLPAVMQCSESPRRPVIVPVGRFYPEPPGSGSDEPPPAGTALAPSFGVTGDVPYKSEMSPTLIKRRRASI
jgi:hypothetical protein